MAHLVIVGEVIGSIPGPNRVVAKDVKSYIYCCYARCTTLIVRVVGMPLFKNRINYLPNTIKGLVVCTGWDLEPLDLIFFIFFKIFNLDSTTSTCNKGGGGNVTF